MFTISISKTKLQYAHPVVQELSNVSETISVNSGKIFKNWRLSICFRVFLAGFLCTCDDVDAALLRSSC